MDLMEQTDGSPAPDRAAVWTCPPPSRGATGTPSHTASRFHGNGVRYKAKLIGVDPVPEPQGDKMCWSSMMKLKGCEAAARKQGKHKQRVWLKVVLSGLLIVDERSGSVLHDHNKTRISSVTRDRSDPRALAYIYRQDQNHYNLIYIRTATLADPVLADIRDICRSVETPQEIRTLLNLNESPAPPEGPDLDQISPKPDDSAGLSDQVSSCLSDIFSIQLVNQFSSVQSSEPPPPQLLVSTSQILSMFPHQQTVGVFYSSPPFPSPAAPWDHKGLLGAQWAGPAEAPWLTMPGSTAAGGPVGVTAPHPGAVSSQLGVMCGGNTPSPPIINCPPTRTGAAASPRPDNDLLL